MTLRCDFTERADAELREIYLYGARTFGIVPAERYFDGLEQRFALLAEFPFLGRPAPGFGKDIRRIEHMSHVVFYKAEPDHVLIVALVHGRSVRGLQL